MELATEEFLQAKKKELFPENEKGSKQREKWLFSLRFHPDNYHQQHRELAKEIKKQLGEDCQNAIGTHIKNVLKTIVAKHRIPMEADGLDTAEILNPGRGKKGAWEEVYQWLWEQEFPRWLTDWWWSKLQGKAETTTNWLQFAPLTNQPIFDPRGLVVPPPKEEVKATITINTPHQMQLYFPHPDRYLLLFNRGLSTRYCLCPSQAFAPVGKLSGEKIKMPQDGAMCPDIRFDEAGKEEFLAILVEEEVSLPWLIPSESNPAPEWNGKQLQQLWESLEKQNWQVFYQSFEVVKSLSVAEEN